LSALAKSISLSLSAHTAVRAEKIRCHRHEEGMQDACNHRDPAYHRGDQFRRRDRVLVSGL